MSELTGGLISLCRKTNEWCTDNDRIITIAHYDKYQYVVQNLNNRRDNKKDNRKGNDPNNRLNKNRDTTNKEIRCVCHKGTHTPEKEKIAAIPPVTPFGGARAGSRMAADITYSDCFAFLAL